MKDLSVFDVFLYANDYHNLKAAIKEARMDSEYPGIYIDQGTVDVKRIREAIRTRDFVALPEAMASPRRRPTRCCFRPATASSAISSSTGRP